MREKIKAIINFPIEWSQRLFYLVLSCSSLWPHSDERYKAFALAKIYRLLVFGAINCLMFAAPTAVHTSEINSPQTPLPIKVTAKDALNVTNQAGSTRPVSSKTDPNRAPLKRRKAGPGKSTRAPKKVSNNPYMAETLLAEHPPPLLKPRAELATPLSGPQSPESVRLFKRLYYNGKRMDRYQGRQFIAEGEAYYSKDIPKGYFMLFRWQIDCCTGEIEPVGIMVRSSLSESPDNTNWVNVDGFLEIQMIDGVRVPCLVAKQVKKMPAPRPEKQFISF